MNALPFSIHRNLLPKNHTKLLYVILGLSVIGIRLSFFQKLMSLKLNAYKETLRSQWNILDEPVAKSHGLRQRMAMKTL